MFCFSSFFSLVLFLPLPPIFTIFLQSARPAVLPPCPRARNLSQHGYGTGSGPPPCKLESKWLRSNDMLDRQPLHPHGHWPLESKWPRPLPNWCNVACTTYLYTPPSPFHCDRFGKGCGGFVKIYRTVGQSTRLATGGTAVPPTSGSSPHLPPNSLRVCLFAG